MYVRAGYVTFGKLAGVSAQDLIDHSAAAAQLPPLEYATYIMHYHMHYTSITIICYRHRRDTQLLAELLRTRH